MIEWKNIPKIVLLSAVVAMGIASTYYFNLEPDNAIEEFSEQIIEDQTGYDIDLSPGTGEDDDSESRFDFELSPAFIFTNAQ